MSAKWIWVSAVQGAFLTLKMNCQKIYLMIVKRFIKNLLFGIKQNFCEATVRLCTGSEGRTRTYAAPCRREEKGGK